MHQKKLLQQGWLKALIFIVAGFAVSTGISLLAGLVNGAALAMPNNLQDLTVFYLLNTGGFILVAVCMQLLIDKQPLTQMGFAVKGHVNDAFAGLCTAVAILATGTLVLMATGHLKFAQGDAGKRTLLLNLLFCVMVAFTEEIVFRGYLLKSFLQSYKPWVALVLSAAVFALFHAGNPNAAFLPVCNVLVAGLLMGVNYMYTRNLWFGIVLHLAWNFLQGPVLGYSVSGLEAEGLLYPVLQGPDYITGSNFGFEGSVVTLVLQIIVTLFLWVAYTKKQQSAKTAA
jgi:hypothetical protein